MDQQDNALRIIDTGKRILVVEDEEDGRQIVRDLLTTAGFEMIEAEDGEKAVTAALHERPDLILMDIQLPAAERTVPRLLRRIGRVVNSFSPQECRNFFRHAGYVRT
jgi:CheY-like chemotaxis protein